MISFQNNLAFAQQLDQEDELKDFRNQFLIPKHQGKEIIYLCGNSLGLQPKSTRTYLNAQLDYWEQYGVEGWFDGQEPWQAYHQELKTLLLPILGAQPTEVTIMNNLTINLHLLMVSFYQPKGKRYKILMEGGAFPSDQYAVASQVEFRGYNAADAIIEIFPREGEDTLRTADILAVIAAHKEDLALILFGGINYYTGQFFDLKAITLAGHQVGAIVGFDLAHAAGNVPVQLHDWEVDFAAWCSYKYLNSSMGGISGIFVHEKHFKTDFPRFAGWWGYQLENRFKMTKGFVPEVGAEGWQVSTSPILLMAAHKASLKIFEAAGFLKLRSKSIRLTGYCAFLIEQVNEALKEEFFKMITPTNSEERGCQLSLICKQKGKLIFDELVKHQIIGDWREPNVIRISPVPLYNTFEEVFIFAQTLLKITQHFNQKV